MCLVITQKGLEWPRCDVIRSKSTRPHRHGFVVMNVLFLGCIIKHPKNENKHKG